MRERMRKNRVYNSKNSGMVKHRERKDGDGEEETERADNSVLFQKIMTLCTYFVLSEHLLYKPLNPAGQVLTVLDRS